MLTLRLRQEDEKLIRTYAAFNNISVSEFMRQSALEKIESEYDTEFIREYEARKSSGDTEYLDHDEVWEKLL